MKSSGSMQLDDIITVNTAYKTNISLLRHTIMSVIFIQFKHAMQNTVPVQNTSRNICKARNSSQEGSVNAAVRVSRFPTDATHTATTPLRCVGRDLVFLY
jgi:hypothetical protein